MEGVHSETQRIIQNISQEQWLKYFHELVLYAESRCRKWQWRTGRSNLPKGFSPDAIANEAIAKLLSGERVWNHETYPGDNPTPFLKNVVASIVYRLGHSVAHQTAASLEDESTAVDSDGDSYTRDLEAAEGIEGFSPPPISSPEDKIFARQIHELVREAIADRPDLITVYEYLCQGMKPAEIAVEMGIDNEVYVKIRTIHRRAEKIAAEILGQEQPTKSNGKEGRTTRRKV